MRKVIRKTAMAFVLCFLVFYGLGGISQAVEYELTLTEVGDVSEGFASGLSIACAYGDAFMGGSQIGSWHTMIQSYYGPVEVDIWNGCLDVTGWGKFFYQGTGDPSGVANGVVTGGTGNFKGLKGTIEITETAPDTYTVILDIWY